MILPQVQNKQQNKHFPAIFTPSLPPPSAWHSNSPVNSLLAATYFSSSPSFHSFSSTSLSSLFSSFFSFFFPFCLSFPSASSSSLSFPLLLPPLLSLLRFLSSESSLFFSSFTRHLSKHPGEHLEIKETTSQQTPQHHTLLVTELL